MIVLSDYSSLVKYKVSKKLLRYSREDFDNLWKIHPENYNKIKIFDKIVETPRWQQSYGKDYYFSGMNHAGLKVPKLLKKYLKWSNKWLEKHYENCDYKFNQILVNWYDGGKHYIGPHSDDIKQLVKGSPILCISLGCTREFIITNKITKQVVKSVLIENGSWLSMENNTQYNYKHEIKKDKNIVGKRISITFRVFR